MIQLEVFEETLTLASPSSSSPAGFHWGEAGDVATLTLHCMTLFNAL